jgi:hypothetical protein
MAAFLESVSVAHFDMTLGAQIGATHPIDAPPPAVAYRQVPDVCFPDGAHGFDGGCAFVTLRPTSEASDPTSIRFGLVSYAGRADKERQRGFRVSALLLVMTRPLFCSLRTLMQQLIDRFVQGLENPPKAEAEFLAGIFDTLTVALAAVEMKDVVVGRIPEDAVRDDFVQLVPSIMDPDSGGTPESGPPSSAAQTHPILEAGAEAILPLEVAGDAPLTDGTEETPESRPDDRDVPPAGGTHPGPTPSDATGTISLSCTQPFILMGQSHSLFIPSSSGTSIGFGASLGLLLTIFGEDLIAVWHALLARRSVLFVGRASSAVGECCLACQHLIHPIPLLPSDLHPYVTLKAAEDLHPTEFWIAGATNPWFDFRTANKPFAQLVCCVGDGVMQDQGPGPGPEDRRFMRYVLENYPTNRGEAWLRKMFVLHTTRALFDLHREIPERVREFSSLLQSFPALPASRDLRRDLRADNKAENQVHRRYQQLSQSFDALFAACAYILDALRPLAGASGPTESELYGASAALFGSYCAAFGRSPTGVGAALLRGLRSVLGATVTAVKAADTAAKGAPPASLRAPKLFPPGNPLLPLDSQTEGTDLTVWAEPSSLDAFIQLQYLHNRQTRVKVAVRLRGCLESLVDALADVGNPALQNPSHRAFHDRFDVPEYNIYAIPHEVVMATCLCAFLISREKPNELANTEEPAAIGWMPTQGRLFITKHYLCLQTGMLSRVTGALIQVGDSVLPFQEILSLAPYTALRVLPNALAITLTHGRKIFIGPTQPVAKLLPLLSFLHYQQLRVVASATPDALRLTNDHGHVAPHGVHTRANTLTRETTWEHQRSYPVLGWSTRLLPTDRYGWSDASGCHRRRREDVTLPDDRWEWIDDWHLGLDPPTRWEYAIDFRTNDWHTEPSSVHMVRRRLWCRSRRLRAEFQDRLPNPTPRQIPIAAAAAPAAFPLLDTNGPEDALAADPMEPPPPHEGTLPGQLVPDADGFVTL